MSSSRAMVIGVAMAVPLLLGFAKGPYLQDVGTDRATVFWQTDVARAGSLTVSGPDGVSQSIDATESLLQEVAVSGLLPSTRYDYRVTVPGLPDETGSFATAPEGDEPFEFAVHGDEKSGEISVHRAIVSSLVDVAPDFVILVGDLVAVGSRESDWTSFFEVEHELLAARPLWPVLGNHDLGTGDPKLYRRYLAVPADAPAPERYYAFRWGAALFLVLDGNQSSDPDQLFWLASQLERARRDETWPIFVAIHQPTYSTALHGGSRLQQELWAPLFARYAVAAVFCGHDHDYERLVADGVTYFVTGGGAAPIYNQDPSAPDLDYSQRQESVHHYLRVRASGHSVEVTAMRLDGTAIETTTITPRDPNMPPPPTGGGDDEPPPGYAVGGGGLGCAVGGRGGAGWLIPALAAIALALRRRRGAA